MPSNHAPFYAGSTITDPRYFVGYEEQLDTITIRAVSPQPTSINVVGSKRVGKSSLLYHFCQTYEQKIESRDHNPRNYLAIYLSLQQGNCQLKSGFYQVIAAELCDNLERRYSWFRQPRELINALQANSFDTESFYETMVRFRESEILPIICLDEIETIFKKPQEFNDGFYDNLRSLMDRNALMLVIASDQNLQIYSQKKKLTSSFFNLGQVMELEGFTNEEVPDLVKLPATKIPGSQAVLNEKEQQTAWEWGGKNPYLLQLACLYIWEAKKSNKNISWARKRFNRDAKGVSTNHTIWRRFVFLLKWLFWYFPMNLSQVGRIFGAKFGDISDAIVGWSIIVILILVAFKILPLDSVIDGIKNVLGLGD